MFDIEKIRSDFPILSRKVNGKPLVYLDSGASAQKPSCVIDAMSRMYCEDYANVHRGLHTLSNISTEKYEGTRAIVARFLGARTEEEIVFTTGSTEGINMVSYAWAAPRFQPGDEIVLSVLEHHANIVPWHFLRERLGVVLKWVEPEADGSLPAQKVLDAVSDKTRLIAVTHMSNVLGTLVDVKAISSGAREKGVPVLVDGSQAAVHMPVNVADIGCDFYVITGHKLYGPSGSGAIWIDPERQAEMRPFMGGGDMIDTVTRDQVSYHGGPLKFEAGTPGIVQQYGMGVALEYLMAIGMDNIATHEAELRRYTREKLEGLNWLNLQPTPQEGGAIFSMTMNGPAHPHDISTILDKRGVAVRAGSHCAMPLMQHLGQTATARASFAMYNTRADTDALVSALELCHELLG